jgi:quinol monooxygenase YgiN
MNLFLLRVVFASKKQQEEALKILRLLTGPTQVQPGCLTCEVFQQEPTQQPLRLCLLEKWETQERLERHIRSEQFRKVLAVMDLANEPPEIEFNTVSQTQGMELIQALRGGSDAVL